MRKDRQKKFNAAAEGGVRKVRDMSYQEIVDNLTAIEDRAISAFSADEMTQWEDESLSADARVDLIFAHLDESEQDRWSELEAIERKMVKMMAEIDKNPESFEAVQNFGIGPLIELGKKGEETIAVQQKFNKQIKILQDKATTAGQTMSEVKELMVNTGSAIGNLVKAGAKKTNSLLKALNRMLKKEEKKSEDQKFVDGLQDMVNQKLIVLRTLKDDMNASIVQAKVIRDQAVELGLFRRDIVEEMGYYINCASEVTRRYDEDYIPRVQAEYEISQNETDRERLIGLQARRQQFIEQHASLQDSLLMNKNAMEALRMTVTNMEDLEKVIKDIIVKGIPQLTDMLGQVALQASSQNLTLFIKSVQGMGDEMMDAQQASLEQSTKVLDEMKSRGMFDHAKILEITNRQIKLLEETANKAEERRLLAEKKIGETREKIRELDEKVDETNNRRLLDSGEEKAAPKRAANDDAPAAADKPQQEQKPAASARNRNRPSR